MATTFTFKGIDFTVPTSELAQALRQLQSLGDFDSSSTRGTSEQAVEAAIPKQQPRSGALSTVWSASNQERLALALRFLNVIKDHQVSGGAPVETIMTVLGVQHPKGVGSAAARINAVLEAQGLNHERVYSNPRDSLGMRYWKAGEELGNAIALITEEVSRQQEL